MLTTSLKHSETSLLEYTHDNCKKMFQRLKPCTNLAVYNNHSSEHMKPTVYTDTIEFTSVC